VSVELWFRDSFETEIIEGDLVTLMNNLNIAAANGKQFAILDAENGPVMVETRNIIKAKEASGSDAFVGR
jgi:hypothetical protein